MKRIIKAVIAGIVLYILSGIGASANGYDESKACVGPAADMIDVYLSPIFPHFDE